MNLQAPRSRVGFRQRLLRWYDSHARDLPWRRTRDPYRIWVSEVMLQQTRVAVVQERYLDFLQRFPTVKALARAREDQVLAAWSGLGYYRRARSLRQAAQIVMKRHRGVMPHASAELQTLPGVGRYTAAAVTSIAFGEPVAVVDGNVERVLARLFGWRQISPARAWEAAEALLSRTRPGDFNQAMMELGATVCAPATPACDRCPVRSLCATRGTLPSTAPRPRRKDSLRYLLATRNGSVRLVQRSRSASVMPGLWELPPALRPPGTQPLLRLRHAIMQTDYDVQVFAAAAVRAGKWVPRSALGRIPLTGLGRKILRAAGVLA